MARATAKKPKASPTPKGKGAVGPPPTKKVQRGGRAAADGRKRPEAKAKRAVSRRTKRKNAEAEVEGKKVPSCGPPGDGDTELGFSDLLKGSEARKRGLRSGYDCGWWRLGR